MKHEHYQNLTLQINWLTGTVFTFIVVLLITATTLITIKLDRIQYQIELIKNINNVKLEGLTLEQGKLLAEMTNAMQENNEQEFDNCLRFYIETKNRGIK